MNFFQAQEHARKSTKKLIFFFLLAVFSLIALTNFLIIVLGLMADDRPVSMQSIAYQFDPTGVMVVSAAIIVIIILGSLFKIISLRGGGAKIAEMLDGRLLVSGSGDVNEQKALNVVEEMAIASGTPVPPLYIMDNEEGINAFAAGYKPGDAIIAVTRGAIDTLSRDELQGVIAHEFSHILNGDMRLNIRLMGLLHGILVIGLIGYYILHVSGRSRRGKGAGGILLFGLGLMIIGYAGTFFGNIIKSAVSRQREYLADASAVQFTRNNEGLTGALKKIGGSHMGSYIEDPNGSEISHAFFSEGISMRLSSLFATHPPLEDRIKRIDPNWDGNFYFADSTPTVPVSDSANIEHSTDNQMAKLAAIAVSAQAIDNIGQPQPENLDAARNIINGIPQPLLDAVHEPHGARAALYFLVLDKDLDMRTKQLDYLQTNADVGVYDVVQSLATKITKLDIKHRLPVINIAISTLRQLSKNQYKLFKINMNALIEMDNKIELFEWTTQKIVYHHLDSIFYKRSPDRSKYNSFKKVKDSCIIVLSLLSISGKQEGITEQDAFDAGMKELELLNFKALNKKDISLKKLNKALDELNFLKPLKKPQLLKALAACITADKIVTTTESELFRAIAEILDCPMPQLIIE